MSGKQGSSCQRTVRPAFWDAGRSISLWFFEPRNRREISYSSSTNLPSTRISSRLSISFCHFTEGSLALRQICFQRITGIAPYILIGIKCFDLLQERRSSLWFSGSIGSPPRGSGLQYTKGFRLSSIFCRISPGKRFTIAEIPCLTVKTARTVVPAA